VTERIRHALRIDIKTSIVLSLYLSLLKELTNKVSLELQ
jgi:hypothetical protein